MSHNARSVSGSTDVGIAVAVDDTRISVQLTYNTSGAGTTTDGRMSTLWERGIIGQNTAVINTAIALSDAGDSTHIFIRTADRNILEGDVLHHAAIDGIEEGMGETRDGLRATIERTAEGLGDGICTTEVERSGGDNLIM